MPTSRLQDLRLTRRRTFSDLNNQLDALRLTQPADRVPRPADPNIRTADDIRQESRELQAYGSKGLTGGGFSSPAGRQSPAQTYRENRDIRNEVGLELPPSFLEDGPNQPLTAIPFPTQLGDQRFRNEPGGGIADEGVVSDRNEIGVGILKGYGFVGGHAATAGKFLASIPLGYHEPPIIRGQNYRGPHEVTEEQLKDQYGYGFGRGLSLKGTVDSSHTWAKAVSEEVTYKFQNYVLPGTQEFEGRVDELKAGGISHRHAYDKAWEETNLNLPRVNLPGEKLDFTFNAQWLMEAGFDPVDLLLTGLTGGMYKAGRLGTKAATLAMSKEAIRESIFGYVGRATLASAKLGYKTTRGTGNIAFKTATRQTDMAKLRRATKGLNVPDWALKQMNEGPLKRNPFTGQFTAPMEQADVIKMYQDLYRDTRQAGNSGIGRIKSAEDLEKAAGFDAPPGDVQRLLQKKGARWLGGALSPKAVARTAGEKAAVLYSQVGVIGQKFSGLAADFVMDAGLHGKGPIREFGIVNNYITANNIKLTTRGAGKYQSTARKRTGSGMYNVAEDKKGYTFGDVFEHWDEDPNKSWFKGLTPDQIDSIKRIRKVHQETIAMLYAEKILTKAQIDQWAQDATEGFHYISRRAAGKERNIAGGEDHAIVMYTGAGGPGSAKPHFLKSRVYDTMLDGVRDGTKYLDPMEAMDTFVKSAYNQVAEARTLEYMQKSGQMIHSKEALRRMNPGVFKRQAQVNKFERIAAANLGRLRKIAVGNRAVQPILNRAAKAADTALDKASVQLDKMVDRTETLAVSEAVYASQLRVANGVLGRSKSVKARNKWQKKARAAKRMLDKRNAQLAEHSREYNDASALYARDLNARHVALGRQTHAREGKLGISDDIEEAQRDYNAARVGKEAMRAEIVALANEQSAKSWMPSTLFPQHPDSAIGEALDVARVQGGGAVNLGGYMGQIVVRDSAHALNKAFGDKGSKFARRVGLVTGTARTVGAGWDIGWGAINGQGIMFSHPGAWAKGMAKSFHAIKDPTARSKYVVDNMDDFVDFAENGGDIGSSEFFQSLESSGGLGRMRNWMLEKSDGHNVPHNALEIWGDHVAPLGRLGTGFNSYLDVAKIEMWKSMRKSADDNVVSHRELASHINNSLGTLSSGMLGVSPTQRQYESGVIFFSPRFTRSAFALVGTALNESNPQLQRDALLQIGSLLAGGTGVIWAAGQALGQEVQLNPFEPGYLTIQIGGSSVGIGGSGRALYDLMFKMTYEVGGTVSQLSNAAGIDVDFPGVDWSEGDALNLLKFNVFDPEHRQDNVLLQYPLNRAAPFVREALTGETFSGKTIDRTPMSLIGNMMKGDFTTPQAVATKMLPFVLQSQVDTEPGEERPGFISSLFQTSGFRERNLSPYEQMEKVRNKAAKTWIDPDKIENPEQTPSGKKWYELPLDARRHFNVNSEWSEELQMRTDAFQDNSNGPSKPYFDEIDKERFDYHEASSNAFRQFALNGNGPQMEAAMHDANVAKAYSRELRENNANYDDVRKKLQESRESGTEEQFNRMVEMYVAEVANNPEFVDEFGNFDYDSRDAQDAVFQTKVSEDLYIRIKNYMRGRLRDGSRIPEGQYAYPEQGEFFDWQDAKETLRPYWDVADNILSGEGNKYALDIYREYQGAGGDPVIQERMKKIYPFLKSLERQITAIRDAMRMRDPEIDFALVKYKGRRAKHPANIGFERMRQYQMQAG